MDDRRLNHLKTGALFVAPGQIMDPGIMKLPRYPNERSRLRADVAREVLEADVAPAPHAGCSFRWLLGRLGRRVFFLAEPPGASRLKTVTSRGAYSGGPR